MCRLRRRQRMVCEVGCQQQEITRAQPCGGAAIGAQHCHQDRPGLFAARTARRPDAHRIARAGAFQQAGTHRFAEMIEMMIFTEEESVVRCQRANGPAAFGVIGFDPLHISRKGAAAGVAHQRGKPRIDQHRLAWHQHDARRRVDDLAHRFEIGGRVNAFANARQLLKGLGERVHAASFSGATSLTAPATSPSTSMISATRPVPRMVAPATPSTGR